ncbi:leucyl/phenylalanyl-tRNA--protein transferase [Nereida sp.]|uniref:leucyl/phenylalanyl-tRNA--protein transferase n=1 Tax=Nereida sp. TaxID=2736090 RepID=UPI003F6960A8
MPKDKLSSDLVLQAYRSGIFPMSEGREVNEIFWVDPRQRGIFELDRFHISRSLAKAMRTTLHGVTLNRAFEEVVDQCAARSETWINAQIKELYLELHTLGDAHSIEVRGEDNTLIGGVYGVAIGTAFFGESMFSNATNGSKMALAYLIDMLRTQGFSLFDTQFLTDHLASLGAVEIPRAEYHRRLGMALSQSANFTFTDGRAPSPQAVLQRNTQTS